MNRGLARLHKAIFYIYAAFAVLVGLFGTAAYMKGGGRIDAIMGLIGVFMLPIGLIHLCAGWGAARGKPWSRILSAVIACVMLAGFPVGTIIAIYIFSQLGGKWHGETISKDTERSRA